MEFGSLDTSEGCVMGVCFGVLKHGAGVDVFVDGFVDRESLWCLLVSRDGSFVGSLFCGCRFVFVCALFLLLQFKKHV